MVLLAMSLLVFASVYAIGNPVDVLINPDASEAEKIKTIKGLGLDKSLLEQYFIFLKNAFKGELGYSFVHNRPAISLILERLPATLELTIFALLIAIIIGIPLGVIAGLNPNNFISRFILSISIFFFSLPTFWVGLIMIMIFSVSLNIFPSTGRGDVVDFLGYKLSFLGMADVVRATMDDLASKNQLSSEVELEAVMEIDRQARVTAKTFVDKF